MKLTNRLLRAIIDMATLAEMGDAEIVFGYDTPETRKKWEALCDAGTWARELLTKREAKRAK